jgi:antibiotic biosynthesis monooxygenase (ABM) superfamily enzyme
MLFPDHVLAVAATVEPGREAEFNTWYNNEHTPDAVRLFSGCIGGARYKVIEGDGSHSYIALYAFESEEKLRALLDTPEIGKLIKIYDEAIGSFSTRKRTTYTKVFEYNKP